MRSDIIICYQNKHSIEGVIKLQKEKNIQYIIEREYLSKLSVEEMLIRIIKSHMKLAKGD